MGNKPGRSQRACALGTALLALALGGCGFGGGDGSAATDGETEGTDGTDDTADASNTSPTTPSTSPMVTTDPATTEPEDTTGPQDTTGPDDTTGSQGSSEDDDTNDACEPFAQLQWAQDLPERERTLGERVASLLPPLGGEPVAFLHGEQAQQGFANFSFDVPCGDDVTLWALAWDAEGGSVDNADSFFYTLDEDETTDQDTIWEYGCDSVNEGRTWQWYRVLDTADTCEGGVPWMSLDEGEHTFRILHREQVSFEPIDFNFAGIAALVVTNDASYDPVDTYDPNP